MTGEEMERAIEFLLQNQATLGERIEKTQAQLSETNRIVQMQAISQSEFNQTITAVITSLAESQRQTDRKLDALIDIVRERLEGKGGG
jgi:hypothetical protein